MDSESWITIESQWHAREATLEAEHAQLAFERDVALQASRSANEEASKFSRQIQIERDRLNGLRARVIKDGAAHTNELRQECQRFSVQMTAMERELRQVEHENGL